MQGVEIFEKVHSGSAVQVSILTKLSHGLNEKENRMKVAKWCLKIYGTYIPSQEFDSIRILVFRDITKIKKNQR